MADEYRAPEVRVEMAPGFHPLSMPGGGDWDAVPGLKAFSMSRGRQDDRNAFEPSTATLTFSNEDGDLDELIGSSFASTCGPLTPVRVLADWYDAENDDTYTDMPIWSGFLLDGWYPDHNGRDRDRPMRVECFDWMGWASTRQMPVNDFGYFIAYNDPVIWWKGRSNWREGLEGDTPSHTDFLLQDFGSAGINATGLTASPNTAWYTSSEPGLADAEFRIIQNGQGSRLTSASSISTGATSYSVACSFRFFGDTTFWGQDSVLASGRTTSIVGTLRWHVFLDHTTGDLVGSVRDSGGSPVASCTVTGSARFDDAEEHIFVFYVSAGNVILYTDQGIDTDTPSGTPVSGGGRLNTGNSGVTDPPRVFSDWAYFEPAVAPPSHSSYSTNPPAQFLYASGTGAGLWKGEGITTRLSRLQTIAGSAITVDLHDSGGYDCAGIKPKSSLADHVTALADSVLGAAWMTRAGELRFRDMDALTDGTYAADYVTSVALLSNRDNATNPVRYSKHSRTGKRLDRVTNEIELLLNSVDLGGKYWERDKTSQDRWGIHKETIESDMVLTGIDTIVGDRLAERADPPVEVGALTIRPWGNARATLFVLDEIELERAVSYEEYPVDFTGSGSALIADEFRVQSESWDWSNGADWTVTINIAPIP